MKKRLWITALFSLCACTLGAQNLVTGARVADLKVSSYLAGHEASGDVPLLIEFFYSASEPCRQRLSALDDLARVYGQRLDVVLLAKESRDKIDPLIAAANYAFSVALDEEGKTFAAYDVKFVPFSVLLDAKGRLVWFGNSSKLTTQIIDETVK